MEASLERVNERYAVLEAYAHLACEQPLEKIKVADICAARSISKSSFYRLFGGIGDILIWYQNFTSDVGMHRVGVSCDFRRGHLLSILLLDQFHDLYRQYVKSAYWNPEFSLQCINNHVEAMRKMIALHDVGMSTEMLYKLRAVAMVSHQFVSYYMNDIMWAEDDKPEAEQLVSTMYAFVPDDLRRIFDSPVQDEEVLPLAHLLGRSVPFKGQFQK